MAQVGFAEKFFGKKLALIENEELRKLIINFFDSEVPDSFWTKPASSSGKYHPPFAAGEGGLVRHTLKAVEAAEELLVLQQFKGYDKDMIIASLLLHDSFKYKDGADYTMLNHPEKASDKFLEFAKKQPSYNENEYIIRDICYCIRWHMGQWSTKKLKEKEIPPSFLYEHINFVQLCDYIASREFFSNPFYR